MLKYIIYGKASCPFCMKIIKKLTEAKKTFYVELLDGNPEKLEQMKAKYNHNTVPIVLVKRTEEILIGGCDDAIKHLEKEHEDATM
jgi:glutaredoxin